MRPIPAVHDDSNKSHEFWKLDFAGYLWQWNRQNEALALTDMVRIGNKPRQPLHDEFCGAIVARRGFRIVGDMCNGVAVISFVWHERCRKLSMCFTTIPALKNPQLVMLFGPSGIDGLPSACPTGEQFSLASRAGKNFLGDNYYEFSLALSPKMC